MIFIAWVYTVPMRLIPLLTAILALASSGLAAKIEGVYIGTLGQTNVVFKLEKPGGTDVDGAYFYRKFSRDIQLNGTLSGSSLVLQERGLYGAESKAKLNLKAEANGFSGLWTDAKSGKSLPVRLRTVTPADLNAMKLPNTSLLRKWKRSEPYEYLRFDAPLKSAKLEKINGKNVQWWLEPRSGMAYFRLAEQSKAINDALTDEQYGMASSALQCPNDGPDGFSYTPRIALYSQRFLSVTGPAYYDCGGAHPDGYNANLTLDFTTGKVLNLEDAYRFVPVPQGLNLQTQEPFELFSTFTLARAAVLKKLISQEVKSFSQGLDVACDDVYQSEDVFQFITWFLSPEGLVVQSSLPHVAAACENDFLLPYSKLKSFLTTGSPLKQ
jgi:hypothetical protein